MENKGKIREHGITLVALVITIIILLILTGVGIIVLNKTELFEKTKKTKEIARNVQEKEDITIVSYEDKIDEITGSRDTIIHL